MRDSTYSNFTDITEKDGRKKLEIKSNIRSIHAYKKHVNRNHISSDVKTAEEIKGQKLTEPVQTKEEVMKKLMNNPENVLMAHEPNLHKNPVVVPVNRVANPEIEIRALKEDKSL